jgi:hypothetical protein
VGPISNRSSPTQDSQQSVVPVGSVRRADALGDNLFHAVREIEGGGWLSGRYLLRSLGQSGRVAERPLLLAADRMSAKHIVLAFWLGASLSHSCLANRSRSLFPLLDLTMKRFAIPSAAALLMVFAGCSSMQSAANTTDIELVLATPPS